VKNSGEFKIYKPKITTTICVLALVFTSLSVNANYEDKKADIKSISENLVFPDFFPLEENGFNILQSTDEDIQTYTLNSGEPMLPVITKTYTFSIGTKIKQIKCSISDVKEEIINYQIKPAPSAVPLIKLSNTNKEGLKDDKVYSRSELYPNDWYESKIGVGRDKDGRAIFVTIKCYPIRYNPKDNILHKISDAQIEIIYEETKDEDGFSENNLYDMVIITPKKFSSVLNRLVQHKNDIGIDATLKTTEDIYDEYPGRDEPEQIKYFIKDAIETWNITYVLLVGGRQNQRLKWYLPVRYSLLHDAQKISDWNESQYISDLYYADIYKYNVSSQEYDEFEDWDSNKNDIFAEWTSFLNPDNNRWEGTKSKDVLDLYPDVYVGRLSCRNIFDVKNVVQKIISYETMQYDEDWFKNIVLVGGDTGPYEWDPINEGEKVTNLAASYLDDFQATYLWKSNGKLNSAEDVVDAIEKGTGFIFFSGHGTPIEWCTHPVKDSNNWTDVYYFQMKKLSNKNMLPVCVVDGCHNSQFDVTSFNIFKGIKEYGLDYFDANYTIECFGKLAWAPRCWSWNLVSQKNGGFIAAIGNTGLGWGYIGSLCTEGLGGNLTSNFFKVYSDLSEQGYHNLGMIHTETINEFIDFFSPNNDKQERKVIEGWNLLGDPSLRIGGYNMS